MKSIHLDPRSKKRLRFASSKERSKRASADVYRSYKDRIAGGVTSASTRERFVHNPQSSSSQQRPQKRQRKQPLLVGNEKATTYYSHDNHSKTAVIQISKEENDEADNPTGSSFGLEEILDSKHDGEGEMEASSTSFATELDVAMDRNASEIFGQFNRQIWLLVRSLPELLHNLPKVMDILLSFLLSPVSLPERPTPVPGSDEETDNNEDNDRQGFIVNLATTDILHLLSVLARDLRHEMHPYLHTKILPRIINDMLNPPPPPPDSDKQPIPLDVTLVEAAFRCMAYVFKYDSDLVVQDMESMRQYYGRTLGNRRELVRRLSAETFAPLIRKMKSPPKAKERHLRRVLRALAATSQLPTNRALQRTQSDAVDGISQLCFQIVRGTSHKLRSDGPAVVGYLLGLVEKTSDQTAPAPNEGEENRDLIFDVVSGMLDRLCFHCNNSTFGIVAREMFLTFHLHVTKFVEDSTNDDGARSIDSFAKHLNLIVKVATKRSGHLLEDVSDKELSLMNESVSKLCKVSALVTLSVEAQKTVVEQLCNLWVALQDRRCMKIEENCKSILQDEDCMSLVSVVLAKNLLPFLQDETNRNKLSSLLIVVASQMTKTDVDGALEVVFAVVSSASSDTVEDGGGRESFSLFRAACGDGESVTSEQQSRLLDVCLSSCNSTEGNQMRLGVALRCLPFVATARAIDIKTNYKKIAQAIVGVVLDNSNLIVNKALAMESFSFLSMKALGLGVGRKSVENLIFRTISVAVEMLLANEGSLWTTRGVASLIPLIQEFGVQLSKDPDALFDVLVPNLRSENHFLRLYSLRILVSFPLKAFVVDHADLDLSDDLDEEEMLPLHNADKRSPSGPTGECRVLETLLELEALQVSIAREKELLNLVTKVEVFSRYGRMPAVYAEAACNHVLGIFHMKFAPLWPIAQKALATLLDQYQDVVWSTFETELVAVMKDSYPEDAVSNIDDAQTSNGVYENHLRMCEEFERSSGKDITLFGEAVHDEGVALKIDSTDKLTVMESIWKTAEAAQKVVAKHSRIIVPLFLGFLQGKVFPSQPNEHDARELHLEDFSEKEDSIHVSSFVVQKRLRAFLSVFAAIDGPQQLFHHKVLEKVFRSFLAHQDATIVELALSCLAKYKLQSLSKYKSMISTLLQKGRLRNGLLDLTEQVNSESMDREQSKELILILSRILFGRVGAKAGKIASKDSPGARRAAVLSFLSVLCRDDADLFPFLYIMTRPFIPEKVGLTTLESMQLNDQRGIMQSLLTMRSDDVRVPRPVIVGFLHLLESVLSQLGHRVVTWVPHFTSITIELCKAAAVAGASESKSFHSSDVEVHQDITPKETIRHGTIRSLCFQRLSELLGRFASAVDFTIFSNRFWESLDPSLRLLPEMVVKNQDCPAILTLLRSMSEHEELFELLVCHEAAVGAVVECISATSMHSVMHSALAFVENLLSVSNERAIQIGQMLVRKFAANIVGNFTNRLEGRKGGGETKSPTWRRELQVLLRVSDLVSDGNKISYAGSLCRLLVPFLRPNNGTTDEDKSNVIGILSSIFPHLDDATASVAFADLSGTLGPYRSKVGITSLSVREGIAKLIGEIALLCERLRPISSLLIAISTTNPKRIDELDFEVVIQGLNSLAQHEGASVWKTLWNSPGSTPCDLIPVINCCFHYLYSEDGVVSRASFSGLKELVSTAAECTQDGDATDGWSKLLESSVVPSTKHGLESRDGQVRRYCILLVREISKHFRGASSVHVCGDLWQFCDEENADLDFFISVTHVQIHRRARAFRRLRKSLPYYQDPTNCPAVSSQSLVNVLIPLTLHPLYESKTNSEEGLALEAIATLGALSRLLSWSKYNTILWSLLTQFDRHPSQERYMVGALCAMIDAFHFELQGIGEASDANDVQNQTSVRRSLENRIIPRMENIVTKHSTDKSGNRTKSLRPSIILALTKLFQKFPNDFFESKLPNILAVTCDVLRSRESNSRDVARTTLARIVCSMDLKYLGDVIRELAVSLTEGYKLHVRAAVVHTILLELSKMDEVSSSDVTTSFSAPLPPFDKCVPALMELIQDDLFGEASERRESQETSVRYVKEASGNKSMHSIEMISKMIRFLPTDNGTKSAVHSLISPFLERLRLPDVDARTIRKIKEVFLRVVVGISNNPSLTGKELLPFVHATILPFLGQDMIESVKTGNGVVADTDDEKEDDISIKVSGGRVSKRKTDASVMKATGSVVVWRPSTLQTSQTEKAALGIKKSSQIKLRSVQDGMSAPKLTGTARHGFIQSSGGDAINEPAAASAVIFCLNLLSSSQKKSGVIGRDVLHMLDPFVPMLTALVCRCRNTEIALLALKCLQNFLRFDLPSVVSCSESLGSQTLHFLSSSASNSNQSDLTQACFKTLTHLINIDDDGVHGSVTDGAELGERVLANRSRLPLDAEQMKILCSILMESIAETEQHNPALNLIKAMMSHRYMSPEFYDLMEAILKLVVRSPKPTLRQQGAGVFVRYLLDYPMGEEKFEQHLKQVIANLSYEYQEGRMSAVTVLHLIIEKLPQELMEKHSQILFLPLVMQLVNDDSKECRLKIADCIKLLFNRCSTELLRMFQDYCVRWSKQNGPLRLASLQVFGLLVESQPVFLRSGSTVDTWVGITQSNLQNRQSSEWETTYFSLHCLEKLLVDFVSGLSQHKELWPIISDCLVDEHPWIKLSSSRILKELFSNECAISVCTSNDGLLFDIARNLCSQLNAPEGDQNEDLSDLATRTLILVVPIMKERPQLCYKEEDDDDAGDDEEEESDIETKEGRDPVFWLMRRLSQIVKNKGRKRRLAVFKCYAAFCTNQFAIVSPHLELMLDGLHRCIIEGKNETNNLAFSQKKPRRSMPSAAVGQLGGQESSSDPFGSDDQYTMAEEVMRLVEDSCATPEEFLTAYAAVKRRARDKKDKRKTEEKAQAVVDPRAFAERKIHKQGLNRERRKRRAQEHRREQGGLEKRRRYDS